MLKLLILRDGEKGVEGLDARLRKSAERRKLEKVDECRTRGLSR